MIFPLMGPGFWFGLGLEIAKAPAMDFFEMLDARPSQSATSITPAATEEPDAMAMAPGAKVAA